MRLSCSFRTAIHLMVVALAVVAACGESSSGLAPGADAGTNDGGVAVADAAPASKDSGAADANIPIGGGRPVNVHVPPGYVSGTPAPLVIMLHGADANSTAEEGYLKLTAESDKRGFLYVHPEGIADVMGNQVWNATDACCNFQPPFIDDSTYLSNLIDQVSAHYTVDPKRVFFLGHSNGAFMSYRMACEHGDKIAAIVSFAGAMWLDLSRCPAKVPVSVLEIHGTGDTTIAYSGGLNLGHPFPAAPTSVADWTTFDGCSGVADTSAPNLNLDLATPDAETVVTKFVDGCKAGTSTELWTIPDGIHIPLLTGDFAPAAIDFLYAHPKR